MRRSSKTPFFLVALTLLFTGSLQNSSENSFPLNLVRISTTSPAFESMMATRKISAFNYRDPLSFQPTSMVLVATLPIGTPSQSIPMVLDTGSQLSWMSCDSKTKPSFQHARSKTFSYLPCTVVSNNNNNNKKSGGGGGGYTCSKITDNTLGPSCDSSHRCLYSQFYADGTYAEGILVTENFTFPSQTTPPLILGCAGKGDTSGAGGILGMNLGPLSFISQLNVTKFSYCLPKHTYNSNMNPTKGKLYLGRNPKSCTFKYVGLVKTPPLFSKPNFERLVYSLPLVNITVGGKNFAVPPVSSNGAGQTIIDSGTQFTYVADEVYKKVAKLVSGLAAAGSKKYPKEYKGLPMCFYNTSENIGKKVGDMSFGFISSPSDVTVVISKGYLFVDVTPGRVCCFTILSSSNLGDAPANIIGNIHQQNLWVEYDPKNKRVGFGTTLDCNK